MFRIPVVAAIAAACLSVPVAAQSAPPLTLSAWSSRVGQEIERHLGYPSAVLGQTPGSGIVRVKFNCSQSGRPDKVALLRSSGNPMLDRAAIRAVAHVATLHPMPGGLRPTQRYVAMILFARDYDDYLIQTKAMAAGATRTNAWYKGGSTVALLDDRDQPAG